MVNNITSLRSYLEAIIFDNKQLIKKVQEENKRGLDEGGTISNLTFLFENGGSTTINDIYRCYNLTNFYPIFTKFMMANGSITNKKTLLYNNNE